MKFQSAKMTLLEKKMALWKYLEDLVIIKALKENPQITQKDLAVKV